MPRLGNASIGENGRATGGRPGDQTGKEVYMREWYSHPWNVVLRPKNRQVADKIAKAMEQACLNNRIGYNQQDRTSLYKEASKVGFNIAKVSVACNTDCSALVAVCVNSAGIRVSKDIYTGNMVKVLMGTGQFTKLTDRKYLSSSNYLMRGDILVKEGSHTAIMVDNGIINKNALPKPPMTKQELMEKAARDVIAGKYGIGNIRKKNIENLGLDYNQVQEIVNKLLKH